MSKVSPGISLETYIHSYAAGQYTMPNPNSANGSPTLFFVLTFLIAALRRAYLRFPLHPLGVLMCVTGPGENSWGPILVVTIIKGAVTRIGGIRLYRRLIPFFIGVAVGHFFSAGTVWALIASFGGEGFNKYPVWF